MKYRSFSLVLFAFLALSLPVRACINETGTNRRGERIELIFPTGENLQSTLLTPTSKAGSITWYKHVIETARKQPSFDSLNQLAVVLIDLGRFPEAVRLLQFLERKYPGHYQTAANVGTAYELMGRNEDALKWILEGIKRNPEDHDGTEWLHIQILKGKLGQLPKPTPGLSILNLDFGNDALPRRPTRLPVGNTGRPLSLYDVAYAVRYQLIERIHFVAAPDQTVASLLLDWANLELLAGTVESAGVLYDAAIRYGSTETRTIAIRKAQVGKILAEANGKIWHVNGQCELCAPPSPDEGKRSR